MTYMYHMSDLILENNSVEKLQDPICGILFLRQSKTQKQFTPLRKIWGIIQLREKGILKVIIHSLFPIDVWMRISEICQGWFM